MTHPSDEKKGDCYSEHERGFMEWGQNLRKKILHPLLVFLEAHQISPSQITLLSMCIGLCAAFVLPFNPGFGLSLLLLHVIADGIDGPLARHTGQDSHRGSFTDTAADQIVVVAVMLALVTMSMVNAIAAMVYVFSYTTVVGFAMIRNALDIPYSWLIRPRFFIYLWIPLSLWVFPSWTLDILIWLCNVLLVIKVITGFMKIRNKL